MGDTNVHGGNMFMDEVEINLNMHGALVLDGVSTKVDDANVVTVDQSGPRQRVVQLHKKLMKPAHLHHIVGHDAVLRLNAQMRDNVLAL
jgi:hypothetical protein